MALIKCPECGKEISDKAVACINCGCPVSEMKPKQEKPAATVSMDMFQDLFTSKQQTAAKPAPVKTVPKEMPELKFFPGLLNQILDKLCGLCGLAGLAVIVGLLASVLAGDQPEFDQVPMGVLGLVGSYLLSALQGFMEFRRAKKFIKKNGYEESIRNDTANMTNTFNAFELCRRMSMVRYIQTLNPASGEALAAAVKRGNKSRWKKRLGYVPYLAILLAAYCLVPRFGWMYLPDEQACLMATHVITLIVTGVYAHKQEASMGIIALAAFLFAPTIYAFYYEDMLHHVLFCAAAAFLGQIIGGITGGKK